MVALAAVVLMLATEQRSPSSAVKPTKVAVTLAPGASAMSVPGAFLGLSTEYWALPVWERSSLVLSRVLSLLRPAGLGSLVLRIGGDSADEALWRPKMRKIAEWVIELTSAWLRDAAALVRGSRARLILDLNLVTATPPVAAQWARAAETALPSGAIVGFEIGNEPDLYNRRYWRAVTAGKQVLPRSLSAGDYARAFRAYARVLAAAVPGAPLLGPAVAYPLGTANWISRLLAGPHPGLRGVTAHEYPFSACAEPGSAGYPTVAGLLTETATAGAAASLSRVLRLARHAHLPFRLTELNSVTCRGVPGISDTFATALWAPDALFELLRAGIAGVNVHIRQDAINAAFSLGSRGLTARPLLYGLVLFARTLGADPQLLNLQVRTRPSVALKAWAVRVRGGVLHLLLINKSSEAASVALRLPATGPATAERLLAPAARSRAGVTLGGQWLGRDGLWHGKPAGETIAPSQNGYRLSLPRRSAALISVRLRAGSAARQPGSR